jgi:hypothetical protein
VKYFLAREGIQLMVSLAELRARNVTPSWQEAVAVMQELIQTVKATTGSAELLPDLEHIALIPNGDVVALPGSPESAVPVRHAAVMLKLLVDGAAVPPELDQFISRNVGDSPQYDSVAEFSRNLAFFERPGRRSDVERLVGRAVAAEQTSRAEEELKRLKERASEVTQVMTQPEFLQQPQKKAQTIPIAAVAALGVVVIGLALFVLTRVRAPQAPASAAAVSQEAAATAGGPGDAGTPAESGTAEGGIAAATGAPAAKSAGDGAAGQSATAATGQPAPATAPAAGGAAPAAAPTRRSFLERAGDAIKSAVNSLVGSEAPAPAAPAAAPPAVAEMKPAGKGTVNGTRSRPRRSTASAPPAAATPAPEVASAPPAPAPAPPPAATSAAVLPEPVSKPEPFEETPIAVFTAADPSVTPAVIVRPVLPKEPPPNVPPEQVGTIEVLVDEQGDVLSVKLISPANRFHERMLVSAAKMWKFRPAYKDGQPVRYRTRVRLTI